MYSRVDVQMYTYSHQKCSQIGYRPQLFSRSSASAPSTDSTRFYRHATSLTHQTHPACPVDCFECGAAPGEDPGDRLGLVRGFRGTPLGALAERGRVQKCILPRSFKPPHFTPLPNWPGRCWRCLSGPSIGPTFI